jgi:MFS family permease
VGGRRDYRVLLLQGILYGAALQLSSITTVLPYVCAELGGPLIIVGLVVPVYMVGRIMGSLFAPRLVSATGSVRRMLAGIAGAQALLILTMAVDLRFLPREFSPYPLLFSAVLLGVVAGCSIVVFPLAMALLLSADQQSDLMLRQTGFGAVLMILISVYGLETFCHGVSGIDDAELLLAASGVMVMSAAACLAVSPRSAHQPAQPTSTAVTLTQGYRYLRQKPWLMRFIGVQTLFTSVALAPMFFSIYAERWLGSGDGELDDLLVFIGVGALVGIPLWTVMRRYVDTRGLLACSAILTIAGAILCSVSLTQRLLPFGWTLGLTLLVITLATQVLPPALLRWIVHHTDDDERVLVLSFNETVVALAYVCAGLVFGAAAAYGPATWPVVVIVAAAMAAAVVAARAPRWAAPA